MRPNNKEIIRDAGRGNDRQAAKLFKQKIGREGAYLDFISENAS
jgi:hypothetical protein